MIRYCVTGKGSVGSPGFHDSEYNLSAVNREIVLTTARIERQDNAMGIKLPLLLRSNMIIGRYVP